MAHTLDEVLAAVTDENTKTDSLITLVNVAEVMLDAALACVNITPAAQAKIEAVVDNATKVQAAVANISNEIVASESMACYKSAPPMCKIGGAGQVILCCGWGLHFSAPPFGGPGLSVTGSGYSRGRVGPLTVADLVSAAASDTRRSCASPLRTPQPPSRPPARKPNP